jgi:hypothetical protein
MVRRIYHRQAFRDIKPSWFGESIGRYGGDPVIDTVGLQTRNSYIDNFRPAPRSCTSPKASSLRRWQQDRTFVKVDDPDTFHEPLYLIQRWRKVPNPLVETVCAENNEDHFNQGLFPIPRATKPDF